MKRQITTAIILGMTAVNAQATGIFGGASDFNVFVRDNFTAMNSDVEGRVAVGGNLDVQNYSFGEKLGGFKGDSLVVGGDYKYISGQVFNGNVKTLDSTPTRTGNTILNGTFSNTSGLPVWAPTVMTNLVQTAGYAGSLSANGMTNLQYGTLTLSGGSGTTRLYNVTSSQLASASNFVIDAPTGTTVVVNVSGTSASFQNAGFNLQGGVTKDTVLLNFFQATSLSMSGIGVNASILAPQADFSFNNGLITGQIAAKSFSGGGQVNLGKFTGSAPVPEPATMVALAMGGLGLLRRRRSSK